MSRPPTHRTFKIGEQLPIVRSLWRARHEEPETQEFDDLPEWMELREGAEIENDLPRVVAEVLETLTSKEKEVLELRFLQEETLQETADRFEVSRERIRQIESKALRKLRHPSRSDKLRPYIDLRNGLSPSQLRQAEERSRQLEEYVRQWEEHVRAYRERKAVWDSIEDEGQRESLLLLMLMDLRENNKDPSDR